MEENCGCGYVNLTSYLRLKWFVDSIKSISAKNIDIEYSHNKTFATKEGVE